MALLELNLLIFEFKKLLSLLMLNLKRETTHVDHIFSFLNGVEIYPILRI